MRTSSAIARLCALITLSFSLSSLSFAQTPAPAAQAAPAPAAQAAPAPAPKRSLLEKAKVAAVNAEVKVQAKTEPAPAPATETAPASHTLPKQVAGSPVVAKVGQQVLTLAELDKLIVEQLEQAAQEYKQKLYEVRSQAIDEYISDAAIKIEVSQSKHNDLKSLFDAEVMGKISPVTEAEVQKFYDENKDRIGDAPPEEVMPQIKGFLTQQRSQEAAQRFISEIKAKHKGRNLLEPPRVKVDATGFSKGPADAPITIIEFADYECGYCSRAMDSVEEVMKRYPGKIRLVYRDFPLNFHPNAIPASIAARCAGAQGKFWEMHTKLFENQSGLTNENFIKWASELGLDQAKYEACAKDPKVAEAVQADLAAGSAVGVSGTPAFFVNGISLSGAQPPEAFVQIIDKELAKLTE